MKLSNQALGAIMMALQKSLLEQSDIVPTLKSFVFESDTEGELCIQNPPKVHFEKEFFQEEKETKNTVGSD